MKLEIDPEWLIQMAELEDNKCLSVAGLIMRVIDTKVNEALKEHGLEFVYNSRAGGSGKIVFDLEPVTD